MISATIPVAYRGGDGNSNFETISIQMKSSMNF
jgi:hypothetical protein